MLKILLLATALLAQPLLAADCPARPGDEQTTLSQVMYHWGKAARMAGVVGTKGMENETSISRTELVETHGVLATAEACADLILNVEANDTHLLPSKFQKMTAHEQTVFLAKFKGLVQIFRQSLVEMGVLCESLLQTPTRQDFAKLKDLERILLEIANRGHGEL